jgi:hypothetical protein
MYDANVILRDNAGQQIPLAHKDPILLTAASLTWHRHRNRAFLDRFSPTVFRAEPNFRSDNCWYDSALPAYEKIDTNVTTMFFMSTSTAMHYPLAGVVHAGKPVRMLAIWRNVSSSTSAAYLWPVTTTSQTEATYNPGEFFFHIACRRMLLTPVLDDRPIQVAVTLMYEATNANGRRLDAQAELVIEKALNASIDGWNTTCSPYYCLSMLGRHSPVLAHVQQPYATACVDLTTNQIVAAGVQVPVSGGGVVTTCAQHNVTQDRLIYNAQCKLVDTDAFHFHAYNPLVSLLHCFAATSSAAGTQQLVAAPCDSTISQTWIVLRNTSGSSAVFGLQLHGTSVCIDPSDVVRSPVALVSCNNATTMALRMVDQSIYSMKGNYLIPTSSGSMAWSRCECR